MWMKLLTEGVSLALALGATYLNSKGEKVSIQDIADKAQKYIDANQKDLDSEENKDDDRWG
jgi:hypothetical protein